MQNFALVDAQEEYEEHTMAAPSWGGEFDAKSANKNGLSKSIVLENKVVINFDFRSGAKKSGHLDYPFQSYGPKVITPPKKRR